MLAVAFCLKLKPRTFGEDVFQVTGVNLCGNGHLLEMNILYPLNFACSKQIKLLTVTLLPLF